MSSDQTPNETETTENVSENATDKATPAQDAVDPAVVAAAEMEVLVRDAMDALDVSTKQIGTLQAGLVNARKDKDGKVAQEKSVISKKLATDFLGAAKMLDDEIAAISGAEASGNEALQSMATGVQMIHEGLKKTIEKHNLGDVLNTAATSPVKAEAAAAEQNEAGTPDPIAAAIKGFKKGGFGSGLSGLKKPDVFAGSDALITRIQSVIDRIPVAAEDGAEGGLAASNPLVAVREKLSENLGIIKGIVDDKRLIDNRVEREIDEARKFGASKLAKDFIDVVDNVDRALGAVSSETSDNAAFRKMFDGVQEARTALISALAQNGIERDEPKNEKFDPNRHESLYVAPVPGVASHTIISVEQSGYSLNGRILRAAKVGIAM